MNWQLLKNVNPPIGKIIMLFDENSLSKIKADKIPGNLNDERRGFFV